MYLREGLVVDSQTLWDQLSALALHLQPSYEALRQGVERPPFYGMRSFAPPSSSNAASHV